MHAVVQGGGRVGPGAKNPGSRLQSLCMAHYINLSKPQFPYPQGAMHRLFPIAAWCSADRGVGAWGGGLHCLASKGTVSIEKGVEGEL